LEEIQSNIKKNEENHVNINNINNIDDLVNEETINKYKVLETERNKLISVINKI